MFNNPGAKIKGLAKVMFWIGMIATVIGVLAMADYLFEEYIGIILAVVILIVGYVVSYLSALFLAAFGELVQTNTSIAEINAQLLEETKKHNELHKTDGEFSKN